MFCQRVGSSPVEPDVLSTCGDLFSQMLCQRLESRSIKDLFLFTKFQENCSEINRYLDKVWKIEVL